MDNWSKAAMLLSLLEDRRDLVLNSLSESAKSKINQIDVSAIELSVDDAKALISEAMQQVPQKAVQIAVEPDPEKPSATSSSLASTTQSTDSDDGDDVLDQVKDRLSDQSPQIIACALQRLSEEDREKVLSSLDDETKSIVESLNVNDIPVSDAVLDIILKEFDFTTG